jgi:hypothetical protein
MKIACMEACPIKNNQAFNPEMWSGCYGKKRNNMAAG